MPLPGDATRPGQKTPDGTKMVKKVVTRPGKVAGKSYQASPDKPKVITKDQQTGTMTVEDKT